GLKQVVAGYFRYHAVPTNSRALATFRAEVARRWWRLLNRRSQRGNLTWARITKLVNDWLPQPRILHPWPNQRFAVKHPREEPDAGMPHVRFWCSEASCHSSGCKSRQHKESSPCCSDTQRQGG